MTLRFGNDPHLPSWFYTQIHNAVSKGIAQIDSNLCRQMPPKTWYLVSRSQTRVYDSMMLDIYGHILPCVRFKNWNLAITCTNMQLDSDMKRNFTSISSQSYHNHDWFCLHHSCSSPLRCLFAWLGGAWFVHPSLLCTPLYVTSLPVLLETNRWCLIKGSAIGIDWYRLVMFLWRRINMQ